MASCLPETLYNLGQETILFIYFSLEVPRQSGNYMHREENPANPLLLGLGLHSILNSGC